MTQYYAQSDGPFSTMTWDTIPGGGGSSGPPTSTDDLDANGHSVTIDVDSITAGTLTNSSASTGGFKVFHTYEVDRTVTVNANIVGRDGDSGTIYGAGSDSVAPPLVVEMYV